MLIGTCRCHARRGHLSFRETESLVRAAEFYANGDDFVP